MAMNIQREILFRGFHPCEDGDTTIYVVGEAVKGRWIEGSLLIYPDGDCFICCDDADPCILNKDAVLPSIVCQYTGLTDKNGRKIFEGDIVKRTYMNIYDIGTVMFVFSKWCGIIKIGELPYFDMLNDMCFEVTGTIWDKGEA